MFYSNVFYQHTYGVLFCFVLIYCAFVKGLTCLDEQEKSVFIMGFFLFLLIKHFCFMEICINESSIEYLENISYYH